MGETARFERHPGQGQDTADLSGLALEARLRQHIQQQAGFRITTVDKLNWICPYSLAIVPAPFDLVDAAVAHLLATKPWTKGKPKTLGEILTAKWSHWLRDQWETEGRLRYFAPDGRWLNPFTGAFDAKFRFDPQRHARDLLAIMARRLAGCAAAQTGAMLERHVLEESLRQEREAARIQTAAPLAPVTASIIRTPVEQARADAGTVALTRARTVIESMLPDLPEIPGFQLAIHYEPYAGVGGDLYDCIELGSGRWLFVIGDVSGHGPEAALIVTAALTALRLLAPQHPSNLVGLISALNDNLRDDLPAGIYITLWAGIVDTTLSSLTSLCAGHHPAVLASQQRTATLQQVGRKGTAVGLLDGTQVASTWQAETIHLREGDILLQCTDGFFDVRHPKGMDFGRLRTMGSLVVNLEHRPADIVARMVREMKLFCKDQLVDDVTLFCLGVG